MSRPLVTRTWPLELSAHSLQDYGTAQLVCMPNVPAPVGQSWLQMVPKFTKVLLCEFCTCMYRKILSMILIVIACVGVLSSNFITCPCHRLRLKALDASIM